MKRITLVLFKPGFLLLILLVFFSSCKKKDSVTFPQTLYLTGISKTSEVRMFNNHAEIKDTSVINPFMAGCKYFNMEGNTANFFDYVTFESSDTAVFSNSNVKYSVVKTGDLFMFYSKDYDLYFDPSKRVDFLLDTMDLYKSNKIMVPNGTNMATYRRKDVRVLQGNYQKLDLSFYTYKIEFSGVWSSGIITNEYFEGAKSAFTLYDTVAVQSYVYHLVSK